MSFYIIQQCLTMNCLKWSQQTTWFYLIFIQMEGKKAFAFISYFDCKLHIRWFICPRGRAVHCFEGLRRTKFYISHSGFLHSCTSSALYSSAGIVTESGFCSIDSSIPQLLLRRSCYSVCRSWRWRLEFVTCTWCGILLSGLC